MATKVDGSFLLLSSPPVSENGSPRQSVDPSQPSKYARQQSVKCSIPMRNRPCALLRAALQVDFKAVKAAIEARADVNWQYYDDISECNYHDHHLSSFTALHAACAVPPDEGEDVAACVVQLLLNNGANVHEMARIDDHYGRDQELQAIHMAAGAGNQDTLKLLIDANADPNAEARHTNCCPIHHAARFDQVHCVSYLVERDADIVVQTRESNTVLHFATQIGSTELIEVVKEAVSTETMANLVKAKNCKRETPVDCAVQYGQLPLQNFNLLWNYMDGSAQVDLFKEVDKTRRQNVLPFVHDANNIQTDSQSVSRTWQEALFTAVNEGKVTIGDLAELVVYAPDAFGQLIDTATTKPKVVHRPLHPLPLYSALPLVNGMIHMTSEYQEDTTWVYDTKSGEYPSWHRILAPAKHYHEVKIRVVLLQGLLDARLLHSLANTSNHNDFLHYKPVVSAMLEYAWRSVRFEFFLEVVHQTLATLAVSFWVWGASHEIIRLVQWCIVASWIWLDLMHHTSTRSFNLGTGRLGESFLLSSSYCAVVFKLTCAMIRHSLPYMFRMYLVFALVGAPGSSQGIAPRFLSPAQDLPLMKRFQEKLRDEWGEGVWDYQLLDVLLAGNVLLFWIDMLFKLRSFPYIGRQLLPIMSAISGLFTMLVVLIFVCMGFILAFWALRVVQVDAVSMYALMGLILNGDAFWASDMLRELDPLKRYTVMLLSASAIVSVVIAAINICIAMLSDYYDLEKERLTCSLSKERARVCT